MQLRERERESESLDERCEHRSEDSIDMGSERRDLSLVFCFLKRKRFKSETKQDSVRE